MLKPIGHSHIFDALTELPPVTLLWGPKSVGKRTMARWLLRDIPPTNKADVDKLRMESAKILVEFFSVAPLVGLKAAIISLDGASISALNSLLKFLEEPPAYIRIILVASGQVLPTVVSRAHVYKCGYLRDEEISTILQQRGWDTAGADKAAKASLGHVDRALEWPERYKAKGTVLLCVKAAKDCNLDLYNVVINRFDDTSMDALRTWLQEVQSERYRLYTPEECAGASTALVGRLDEASRSGARAKLAIQYALYPFVKPGG